MYCPECESTNTQLRLSSRRTGRDLYECLNCQNTWVAREWFAEQSNAMTDDERRDATVLVVDDEQDLADLYSTLLATEYDVRTAYSGEEALQKVDDSVDVVLLDRRMPDMTGDEVLGRIHGRSITVQVAMLTGVDPDVDIVEMPFDDYRTKPVGRNDLFGVVETLLKRARYDKHSQELFSLASKRAALEIAENDDTVEYQQLTERMRVVRKKVDASLDEVSVETAFKDLGRATK